MATGPASADSQDSEHPPLAHQTHYCPLAAEQQAAHKLPKWPRPWQLCSARTHPHPAHAGGFTSVSSSILAPSACRSASSVSREALLDCWSGRSKRHGERRGWPGRSPSSSSRTPPDSVPPSSQRGARFNWEGSSWLSRKQGLKIQGEGAHRTKQDRLGAAPRIPYPMSLSLALQRLVTPHERGQEPPHTDLSCIHF